MSYRDDDDKNDEYGIGSDFYKESYAKKGELYFKDFNKTIDISVFPSWTAFCQLIIHSPTNIWIESQVAGHACHCPSIEGFVIDCPKYWVGIDDCEMGCHLINDLNPALQSKVANAIQEDFKYIQSKLTPEVLATLSVNENMTLNFDFDRINELEEAWWPVLVDWNGQKGLKGYLTGWNCD